ncbi:MAG: hypothetical protein WCK52_06410 [Betaproteobacteria bacterium]
MFDIKKGVNTYIEVDENLQGAAFEQRWFESVVMTLKRVQDGYFNVVEAHKKLIEICEGMQWVQANLNERLSSQHRTLLKQIYSVNIQIINSAIETKNMGYLDIVISSLKTTMEPYYRRKDVAENSSISTKS